MAIELRNVSLRVGAETHIYETSLSLQPGQFNILLGTTLSGKTSLIYKISDSLPANYIPIIIFPLMSFSIFCWSKN